MRRLEREAGRATCGATAGVRVAEKVGCLAERPCVPTAELLTVSDCVGPG